MQSLRKVLVLGIATVVLFGALYPLAMVGVGQLMPRQVAGLPLMRDGVRVGFENIGQSFSGEGYFWGRPSAVDYNAAATGGSNLGPTNPDFLALTRSRLDTLLARHPGLTAAEVPIELVTASGSGLDPHISRQGALVQVNRVARARGVAANALTELIDTHTEAPLLGLFGPAGRVNVLRLNLALDAMAAPTP